MFHSKLGGLMRCHIGNIEQASVLIPPYYFASSLPNKTLCGSVYQIDLHQHQMPN